MTRRKRSDSVDAAIDAFENADRVIPLPEGVILRDDLEMVIWEQFCKARPRNSWRDFDLVILAKVVRLEADIRRHQETLDKSGPLIRNKRETLIENPLIRVIDTLQRTQLSLIRSMSLTQTGVDPRTLAAQAATERAADTAIGDDPLDALLARPMPN